MKKTYNTFIIRPLIVAFWLSMITLFLYLPTVIGMFRDQRSINVLIWGELIDTDVLQQFEEKTGIQVHVNYFEYNEELLAKLQATKQHGYDLIMPSDYMVATMREKGLIKKFDTGRLNFFNDIRSHLRGHSYDPKNEYSIPYCFAIYGIGINKEYFGDKQPEASWALLFDENIAPDRIAMVDDTRDLVGAAAKYLFGDVKNLTDEQIKQIGQLLTKQKQWVEMYSDLRTDVLLATKAVPAAMAWSAHVTKVMRQYDHIDFLIPKEGSFLDVDTFAMPTQTAKDDLIYEFLNFVYSPDILKHNIDEYLFPSPLRTVPDEDPTLQRTMPTKEQIEKSVMFRHLLSEKQLHQLWIDFKS